MIVGRTRKERLRYGTVYDLTAAISRLFNRKQLRSESEKLSCRPFFLVGSGRNGSTLMASVLSRHKDLFVAPEQFALPYAIMRFQLSGWKSWSSTAAELDGIFKDSRRTTDWDLSNYQRKGDYESLAEYVDHLYRNLSGPDVQRWGDKTPLNTYFLPRIVELYPDADYIFLIRDGRDVVSSLLQMMGGNKATRDWTSDQLVERACALWNDSITAWDWLSSQVPSEQMLTVRYEDFVSDTEGTATSMQKFLGVNPDPSVLDSDSERADSMGVSSMEHHQNLSRKIAPRWVGKWEKELPDHLKPIVNHKLSSNLQRFNYT
jgi:hypothetical protein